MKFETKTHVFACLPCLISLGRQQVPWPLPSGPGAEEFFMNGPPRRIRQTFLAVFDTATAAKEYVTDDRDIDELALDERRAYAAKVSKWVRSSLNSVQDMAFWYVLFVSHKARSPLTAFFAMLCADGPEGLSKGSGPSRDIPVVKLICERIPAICHMFEDLIADVGNWSADAVVRAQEAVSATVTKDDDQLPPPLRQLESFALDLTLLHYTAFQRRIAKPFSRFLV